MSPQIIQAIRVFLQRASLNGSEVPAYNAIMAELDATEKAAAEAMRAAMAPAVLKAVPDAPAPDAPATVADNSEAAA